MRETRAYQDSSPQMFAGEEDSWVETGTRALLRDDGESSTSKGDNQDNKETCDMYRDIIDACFVLLIVLMRAVVPASSCECHISGPQSPEKALDKTKDVSFKESLAENIVLNENTLK
jgi:hypothetical protein